MSGVLLLVGQLPVVMLQLGSAVLCVSCAQVCERLPEPLLVTWMPTGTGASC
jgi:hypothetical protein